ncbi:YhgE/Pip domain-containing protein [Bacillus sp. REN16]|uniref:YhgE/Pip domain-containing protein n=1 Tax=Bacillus sp. REN16 TaxID=2887296 RepID=UPI001E3E4B0A|nr:YhgE/Pip domain-containing protein [Bacillus sp. REN16]MCC3356413.1 YhgE/Pip domain-containing protein [Bacillus sp. REN16]
MKNIRMIFINDIKNTLTNWVAAVVILALILLPSLYAWFNIKASWDPYGNTNHIPVGIVSEDQETMVDDKEIHVGDDLTKTLKDNNSFEWHFLDRNQAMDEVKSGELYAVIVIPSDFSKKLGTVISDHPTKATVEYYVNEKVNAISPKITEKGANVITEKITSQFISTVNGVIFEVFNQLGIEIEQNLPDIERFQTYVFLLEEKMPSIKLTLDDAYREIIQANSVIRDIQELIPKAQNTTNQALQTIGDADAFLSKAETRFKEISPIIKQNLVKVQNATHEVDDFIHSVNLNPEDLTKTNTDFESLKVLLSDLKNESTNQGIHKSFTQLDSLLQNPENEQLNDIRTEVNQLKEQYNTQSQNQVNNLNIAIQDIGALQQQLNNIPSLEEVQNNSNNTRTKVDTFINQYNNEIETNIRTQLQHAKDTLRGAKEIILEIQKIIPRIETILQNAGGQLQEGKNVISSARNQYPYLNQKVNELANKIRDLNQKANINDLIELLRNDPEAERGFFAEPVGLDSHKLFPIPNYGTGMTPFYTVLSLWVGGLLMISLLTIDAHGYEGIAGRDEYFGKALTFLTIGVLQTIIVTAGDMWLLGVEVSAPFYFILFSIFISLVFVVMIYTLVSVLGNVGKALAIVLLVLQISSSGGTFPVVLLPNFFQYIHPYLPFTYAISLTREAVGGIVWETVYYDLFILTIFGSAAIIIGAWLKEPINKLGAPIKQKLKKSGLFH